MPKYSTIGGLNSEELKKVQRILGDCENLERAQIFGSRAMNTHKPSSDVDLALFGEHLSRLDVNALKIAFEDSPLPHTFDLILHRTIKEPELLAHIQRRGMDVYREGFYLSKDGEWIPEGWDIVRADQFCDKVADGTHDSPKQTDDGYLLVTSKNIKNGRLDLSNAYHISEQDFIEVNRRSKVHRWDVLYSMIGTVGESCLITDEPQFAIKNVGLFKSKSENHGKWLKYYLKSPQAIAHLNSGLGGTTQKYITLGYLREFPIPETKKLERDSIVSVLSSLDDKIELLREQNETLEALAQTLFKRWFIDFNFPCLLAYSERTQADYPELGIYGHSDFGGLPQPEQGSSAPNGQAVKCFVYVLRLENGNRYVGLTDFLLRRYHEHKTGQGAKATKASQPVAIIHFETFDSREAAAEREQWLKTGFGRKWLDREEEKGNLGAHVMQAPMIASELGEIPEGWKVAELAEFGRIVCGKTPSKKEKAYFGHDIPFIKIPDMHGNMYVQTTGEYLSEEGAKSQATKSIPRGSIVVSCIATVGLVALTSSEAQTNQQINSIVPAEEISREYLFLRMKTLYDFLQNLGAGGSATLNINTTSFSAIKVLQPDDYTLSIFNEVASPVFQKIEANSHQIQILTQLRDTLLPKLMKGEIRADSEF